MLILAGAALLGLALFSGCQNQDATTQTEQQAQAPQCDPNAPSLIPPVQGRPQLVEFYRDT